MRERFTEEVYKSTAYFTHFCDIVLGIDKSEGFYHSLTYEEAYKYGTKWFDFYIDDDQPDMLVISGDTAWSPCLELSREISKAFGVSIEHHYVEEGMDFAGYRKYSNGECMEEYESTVSEYYWKELSFNEFIEMRIAHLGLTSEEEIDEELDGMSFLEPKDREMLRQEMVDMFV